MVKTKVGDEIIHNHVMVKVRLDYKGQTKPSRFMFNNRNTEKVAEEMREQKVAMLRNVPLQGIKISDIDLSADIYTVIDDRSGDELAFAPVTITVLADTVEDLLRIVLLDEFRKIEIIEPEQAMFTKYDLERLLFKMKEELSNHREMLERKYSQK